MTLSEIHKLFLNSSGIATDTRKIEPGTIFVAIRGEKFNANAFAREALEKGAAFAIIDDADFVIDHRTVLVEDGLQTLQELAAFHRAFLGIPIVGLTGSNGKTTTKELINAVLSKKYRTVATVGNLNNHIGVPLTLLSFDGKTEIGIVEMGANHQKEIEFLCSLAKPDLGYITNFGKAHLEGFGGLEGVIKGKSELYDHLRANAKMAIVNADDPIQVERAEGISQVTFGLQSGADLKIDSVSANPFVVIECEGQQVNSQLIGAYNANNINAAICVGKHFGVSISDARAAIEGYVPANNRSQIIHRGSNEIILDAYNANPSSMAAATANFIGLDKPSKAMVLGDMFELGEESMHEHKELIGSLSGKGIETHFIGKDFYANRISDPKLHFYADLDAFSTSGAVGAFKDTTLLIKGSRGMALERILELLPA